MRLPFKLPLFSSPAVATNHTGWEKWKLCRTRISARVRSSANPLVSSPMPGAYRSPSFSRTVQSVPFGNTVSRWAEITTGSNSFFVPGQILITLLTLSISVFRPILFMRSAKYTARSSFFITGGFYNTELLLPFQCLLFHLLAVCKHRVYIAVCLDLSKKRNHIHKIFPHFMIYFRQDIFTL